MVVNNRLGYLFVFLGMSMALYAQRKTEVIRYGDLDQWVLFFFFQAEDGIRERLT